MQHSSVNPDIMFFFHYFCLLFCTFLHHLVLSSLLFTSGSPAIEVSRLITPATIAEEKATFQSTVAIVLPTAINDNAVCAIVFIALNPAFFAHSQVLTLTLNTQFLNIKAFLSLIPLDFPYHSRLHFEKSTRRNYLLIIKICISDHVVIDRANIF